MDNQTGLQKGVAGFLGGANITATGLGNLAKMFQESNKKLHEVKFPEVT